MKAFVPAARRGVAPRPGGRTSLARSHAAAALVAGVAIVFPLVYGGQSYLMSVATLILIYGLVAVTLNLLIGYGGQVSLGHAGLLAVGSYTAAILANDVALPFPLELVAAAVTTALVGLALGLPTGRLRGHYLAIATLGFGLAVPQIANNLSGLTNGFEGLTVPAAALGGLTFATPVQFYYLVLVVVALSLLAITSLLGTSTGRSFMAVRDSEAAALAMGINTRRTKVVLFTTSAFFCGLAGDLYAHQVGVVAPSNFPFALSLIFLAMVIVGGLASVWGSLAGALVLQIVQEVTSGLGGLSSALIGAAVVLVLLVTPEGLAALPRHLRRVTRGRRPVAEAEREPASREVSSGT